MSSYSRGAVNGREGLHDKVASFLKIRSVDEFKLFIKDNRDFIKKIAFPFVVILAVIFFWIYGSGGGGDVVVKSDSSDTAVAVQSETDAVSSDLNGSADDSQQSKGTGNNEVPLQNEDVIYVDICGEVKSPGVYELKGNTRLFQLIEMAGGLTEEADSISINRASVLVDGQKVIIKSTDNEKNETTYQFSDYTPSTDTNDSKININTADSIGLQDIPGIGPSKALSIVSYREEHGPYKKIDDIVNVSGIGDRTFDNIKDYITV